MNSPKSIQQHIYGCDVIRLLISKKSDALKKVDRPRYEKYYQREIAEIRELHEALESLIPMIEYPLMKRIVRAVEAAKQEPNLAGVIVYYPFRPVVSRTDNFSLLNFCNYGE